MGKGKPAGSWATIILEQIEDMQEYYSRYLPQMYLAVFIPVLILIAVFPINWAAGLILFVTAPDPHIHDIGRDGSRRC